MTQTNGGSSRGSPPRTPRWVKVLGIIVIILILLFVLSLLLGVRHGPGIHSPSGDAGAPTPISRVAADHTLPIGYGERP